jgi:hypothetical protein
MPKKMMMNTNLSNSNPYFLSQPTSQSAIKPAVKSTSLSSGMISRIHAAKAGCGSCGR